MEPKCLSRPDRRGLQIIRNSFGNTYSCLNIYIRSPLTKSKKNLWKREKKNAYICQPRTKKQIIQIRNIFHSLISYLLENARICKIFC